MRTAVLETAGGVLAPSQLEQVVRCLGQGGPVGLPTETVYGLAAPALDAAACVRIFEAKHRPLNDPLICHLPDIDRLEQLALVPALANRLAEAFWPGPLTLVVPKTPRVPDLVTAGLPKVAIRCSAHPVFRQIIEAFDAPLAAPSANRFGKVSPTCAAHVVEELGGRIPLVVDGGPCCHGIESTIVELRPEGLRVLRSGPITGEMLAGFARLLGPGDGEGSGAPGQMASHYAPDTPLRLLDPGVRPEAESNCGLLAWNAPCGGDWAAVEYLSPTGDLRAAAAGLYSAMRRLDRLRLAAIYAEPVPETGLGRAIMERLRKAAARG